MYAYFDEDSKCRATDEKQRFIVDYSLGYPVNIVDEDGSLVSKNDFAEEPCTFELNEKQRQQFESLLYNQSGNNFEYKPGIHGTGVFATSSFFEFDIVGIYKGQFVCLETFKDWEEERQQFLVILNDGANGIAIDGSFNGINNELKFLNHSCDPNLKFTEIFYKNHWHVVAIVLKTICKGEELTADFELHTEDSELSKEVCFCDSLNCRKFLFTFHPE